MSTQFTSEERGAAAVMANRGPSEMAKAARTLVNMGQLETGLLVAEIFRVIDDSKGGGRRRRGQRGGGPIRAQAVAWLWGKISGGASVAASSAAAAAPDTAAALTQLATATGKIIPDSMKAVDKKVADTINIVTPVVNLASSAAPAVGLAGLSAYAYSHPSLAVGIGDFAARIAVNLAEGVGGLGPTWPALFGEIDKSFTIVAGTAKWGAEVAAGHPYVAACIAWVLLDQYANSQGTKPLDLLKSTGSKFARGVASVGTGVASGLSGAITTAASDTADVLGEEITRFNTWLEQRHIPAYDTLLLLQARIQKAMKDRAKELTDTDRDMRKSARLEERAAAAAAEVKQEIAEGSPKAGTGEAAKSGDGSAGDGSAKMEDAGGRRRLTSRRHHRRASAPRRTRRSSSGRRRGNSRRRRE